MSAQGPRGPIWLVGFMGAGKSAVARALAQGLGWDLVDIDERIVSADGRTIEAIFRESGEGRFREMERKELERVEGSARVVVATGGGSFIGRANRDLMKRRGIVVWLDVPLEIAKDRIGAGDGRPLWRDARGEALRAFFEKRRAAYALADVRVDASWGTPQEIADRTLRAVRR